MHQITLHKIVPCAEDNGATKTLYGRIDGLNFISLAVERGDWSAALFVAGHCAVYKRDKSLLTVSANGIFSFTRLQSEDEGMALLADLATTYAK